MPVKIGRDIVIHEDMVFDVGYGDPTDPQEGMVRYDPEIDDFEFYMDGRWAQLHSNRHYIYDMIRYNKELEDFEFLIDGVWTLRCDCPCPVPDPCPPCPITVCPVPDPCPPCDGFLMPDPDYTRHFVLKYEGMWSRYATGSVGIYFDYWDLSLVPVGAEIDFKYNAYIIPDRFLVEYPVGTIVFDSGWVSSDPEHDLVKKEDYQFNVSHPGSSTIRHLITKDVESELRVIVFGSENSLTEWRYALRYHYKNIYTIRVRFHPEEIRYNLTWGIEFVGGAYSHDEVAFDIPPGRTTLVFSKLEGWVEPFPLDVFLTEGLPDYQLIVDAYYKVEDTKLHVDIEPPGARMYARWKIQGLYSTYGHNATIELEEGEYVIEALPINGWTTPSTIPLTIDGPGLVSKVLTYNRIDVELVVTIEPPVLQEHATWDISIQSGVLSSTELADLETNAPFASSHSLQVPFGRHDIIPSNHIGWSTPVIPPIEIDSEGTYNITITYEVLCSNLSITIYPDAVRDTATWTIVNDTADTNILGTPFGTCNTLPPDAGPFIHNHILPVPYGVYQVTGSEVPGWVTPTLAPISIVSGSTVTRALIYEVLTSQLQIIIEPHGLAAEWNVDDITGIMAGNATIPIEFGTYTIFTHPLAGWNVPDSVEVEINTTETVTVILTYTEIGVSLTVYLVSEQPPVGDPALILTPETDATWDIMHMGGIFTHEHEMTLPYGEYNVIPHALTGWTAPTNEVLIIDSPEDREITFTYVQILAVMRVDIYPISIRDNARWIYNGETDTPIFSGQERLVPFGPYTITGIPIECYDVPELTTGEVTSGEPIFLSITYNVVSIELTVIIIPAVVAAGEGRWRIIDGTGTTVHGFRASELTVTLECVTGDNQYILNAKDVAGYDSPEDQVIEVSTEEDGDRTITIEYIPQTGWLTVYHDPDHIDVQWSITGDNLAPMHDPTLTYMHNDTLELLLGNYTVHPGEHIDWFTPTPVNVDITNNCEKEETLVYLPKPGRLIVHVDPDEIAATWHFSDAPGTTYTDGYDNADMDVGEYTLVPDEFTDWVAPDSETITIESNETTEVTFTYIEAVGFIQVTIIPDDIGAKWGLVSGPPGMTYDSGHSLERPISGNPYAVYGTDIAGYTTPSNETGINVILGGTVTRELEYALATGCITVTTTPAGLDAKWFAEDLSSPTATFAADHEAESGDEICGLDPGTYNIRGEEIAGYAIPTDTITVVAGGTATETLEYESTTGCITVTTTPAGLDAKWFAPDLVSPTATLDPAHAYDSGDTVCGLSEGTYTLEGEELTGYDTPNGTITVVAGGTATGVLNYDAIPGTLIVNIVPDDIGAQWYLDGDDTDTFVSGHSMDLPAGTDYTVSGTEVTDYDTPGDLSVDIVSGETTEVNLLYAGMGCGMDTFSGSAEAKAMPLTIGSGITYIKIRFTPYSAPDRICIYEGDHSDIDTLNSVTIINGKDIATTADGFGLTLLYDTGWISTSAVEHIADDKSIFGTTKYPGFRNFPSGDDLYINTMAWSADAKTIIVFGEPTSGTGWSVNGIECYTTSVPTEHLCHTPLSYRPTPEADCDDSGGGSSDLRLGFIWTELYVDGVHEPTGLINADLAMRPIVSLTTRLNSYSLPFDTTIFNLPFNFNTQQTNEMNFGKAVALGEYEYEIIGDFTGYTLETSGTHTIDLPTLGEYYLIEVHYSSAAGTPTGSLTVYKTPFTGTNIPTTYIVDGNTYDYGDTAILAPSTYDVIPGEHSDWNVLSTPAELEVTINDGDDIEVTVVYEEDTGPVSTENNHLLDIFQPSATYTFDDSDYFNTGDLHDGFVRTLSNAGVHLDPSNSTDVDDAKDYWENIATNRTLIDELHHYYYGVDRIVSDGVYSEFMLSTNTPGTNYTTYESGISDFYKKLYTFLQSVYPTVNVGALDNWQSFIDYCNDTANGIDGLSTKERFDVFMTYHWKAITVMLTIGDFSGLFDGTPEANEKMNKMGEFVDYDTHVCQRFIFSEHATSGTVGGFAVGKSYHDMYNVGRLINTEPSGLTINFTGSRPMIFQGGQFKCTSPDGGGIVYWSVDVGPGDPSKAATAPTITPEEYHSLAYIAVHEAGHSIDYLKGFYDGVLKYGFCHTPEWRSIGGWELSGSDYRLVHYNSTSAKYPSEVTAGDYEPPPTSYGCTDVHEDFAESWTMYIFNPAAMQMWYPRRYTYMNVVVKGWLNTLNRSQLKGNPSP